MNRRKQFKSLAFGVAGTVLWILGCESHKYPWGRDTRASFSKGRLQILHASRPNELLLYDYDRHVCVVRHVKTWRRKGGLLCLVTHAGESWEVSLQTGTAMLINSAEAAKNLEP